MRKFTLVSVFTLCVTLFFCSSKVEAQLSAGTYPVGPGQTYTTIGSVITALGAGVSGPVIFELQSDYTSGGETFPLTFTAISGTSVANTVTIRPVTGATGLSISGSNTTAIVQFDGGNYITIDGRAGGVGASQLSITNTSTATGGAAIRLQNESSNNIVRYITARSSFSSSTTGVIHFATTSGANGNDNNTIDNCNINGGAAATASPTSGVAQNGIYSVGTTTSTAHNNSGNTISNCNIYDFYVTGATTTMTGILVGTGNTDWTISGNSIYQTNTRTATTGASTINAITVSSGNNHSITGNFIGGNTSSAGGTAWTQTLALASRFVGINLAVGTTTATSVQNNTIANFNWSTTSGATTAPGIWCGIYSSGGWVNIGTTTGNTVGATTGTGSISVTSSTNGGILMGISLATTARASIENNKVGSITLSGSTTSIGTIVRAIDITSVTTDAFNIKSNVIGSTTTANSINIPTLVTTAAQEITGIRQGSANANVTIEGNTIANLNIASSTTSTSCFIRGIAATAGANNVINNTIRDFTSASASVGTTTSAGLQGIQMSSSLAGGNQTVSGNTIHSLVNSAASAGVTVTGIVATWSATGTLTCNGNFIHSIGTNSSGTGSFVRGIYIGNGIATYSNNMIRLGLKSDGTSYTVGHNIYGIDEFLGTNTIVHNTVYIGGTGVTSTNNTIAFFAQQTVNTRTFRNNIFVNDRQNGSGSALNIAAQYAGTFPNASGLTLDNNIYFARTTANTIRQSTTNYTLQTWRAASNADLQSGAAADTTDINFVNARGAAVDVNLHVQGTTVAEAAGVVISGVTTDFDGQTRSGLTPVDIGADAGSFTAKDIYTPLITIGSPLLNSASVTNRTLSGVTIVDIGTAVPASGSTAPKIWFRRSAPSTSAWASKEGVLNTGDGNSGTWSFEIDYSLLSITPVAGETYQYYIVAQDQVGTPNVWYSPFAGASHVDVATQTTAPTTPNSYAVVTGLATSFSIPTDYPTLTGVGGLFEAINAASLTGNTTVTITGDITETGAVALINAGMGGFTLTIQPDASARVLSGGATTALFDINGANGVFFDGGASRNLTLRNSIGATPSATAAATVQFRGGVTSGGINNCYIEGNASTSTIGTVLIGTGTNSGLVFRNNDIRAAANTNTNAPANAIYSNNSSNSSITIGGDGASINGNSIYDFTGTAINLTGVGNGCVIGHATVSNSGNTIYQTLARAGYTSINIGAGSNHVISNNKMYSTAAATHTGNIFGIVIAGSGNGLTVNSNSFGGADATRGGTATTSSGYIGAINIAAGSGTGVEIQGNNIGNLITTSTTTGYGIQVSSGTANIGTTSANTIGGAASNDINVKNGFVGIYYGGANTVTIENNTIRNLSHTDPDWERVLGIGVSSISSSVPTGTTAVAATATIKNNLVNNIYTATTSSSGTNFGFVAMGILLNVSTTGNNVEGNTITNIGLNSASTVTNEVTALAIGNIAGGTIHKNKITNVTTTGTGTTTSATKLWGIRIFAGTATYANNQVTISQSTATQPVIRGIELASTSANNIWYNTVYIGGTAAAANSSHAFFRTTTGAAVVQNNLLYNERSGGSSTNFAIGYGSAGAFGTINNNVYITASASTVGQAAGSSNTLAAWKTSTGSETVTNAYLSGVAPNTLFTDVANGDLSIVSNASLFRGLVAGRGVVVATTTDYGGTSRSGSAPSVGSFEYATIPGLFVGYTNSTYATTTNWNDVTAATGATNVTVPAYAANMPVLGADGAANNLTLGTAATLTIGSNTLTINGAVSGTGTISGSSTSNLTIGGTAGTLNFTSGARTLKDFTLGAAATATLGTALDIVAGTTFGTLTVGAGATLTTGGNLTIKSDANGTARVANSAGSVSGNVTVERYLPAKRAWRLLTAPLGGSNTSFNSSWQNGGSVVANTGVEIWHPSGGTGVTTAGNAANLKTFDVDNNAWVAVTNTQTTNLFTNAGSAANNAFLIFPTGPYNGTGAGNDQSTPAAITTLKATGSLQIGTQTFSIPDAAFSNSEKIQLIGNPYASPVNFNLLTRTNVTKRFWAWDPQLSGVGGYVLVSDLDDDNTYTVTPGGSTQTQHIQSGQAFFVEVNNTGASLVFNEDDKSTSNINTVFRTGTGTERLSIDMINPNDGLVIDGILAEYNNNFSNGIAAEDGQKLFRSNENFYLTRNTKPLMLEGRKLIDNNDTLFLTLSGMQQQAYRFAINGSNFANDANLSAYLKDKFLSTETAISLSGATEYNFTVTADNNSKAADRFMVVFRSNASLPVTLTNVKAYQQNSGIAVEWNTQSESGMQQYEVEKSANGTNFVKVNTTAAKSGTTNSYNWFDATPFSGANYYRIKAISLNGEVKYSSIVVVRLNTKGTKITLYPNPVKGSTIQLQLSNLEKGNYSVTLFNQLGQQVMSKTINHNGGSSNQTIEIGTIAGGVYELRLSNGQTVITQKLIKE